MRLEGAKMPFHPVPGPTLQAMAYAAPELLQSFRDDGHAGLTKASDMYSFGCFAYEVRTCLLNLSPPIRLVTDSWVEAIHGTPSSPYDVHGIPTI